MSQQNTELAIHKTFPVEDVENKIAADFLEAVRCGLMAYACHTMKNKQARDAMALSVSNALVNRGKYPSTISAGLTRFTEMCWNSQPDKFDGKQYEIMTGDHDEFILAKMLTTETYAFACTTQKESVLASMQHPEANGAVEEYSEFLSAKVDKYIDDVAQKFASLRLSILAAGSVASERFEGFIGGSEDPDAKLILQQRIEETIFCFLAGGRIYGSAPKPTDLAEVMREELDLSHAFSIRVLPGGEKVAVGSTKRRDDYVL